MLEIEKLFIKNRGILATYINFGAYWLGGVASVVNTGRPLPPHHYLILLYSTLTYPHPHSLAVSACPLRAPQQHPSGLQGVVCECMCVWQCVGMHVMRVCCVW